MDISLASILDNMLSDVWFQLTFLLVVSLFASLIFARFGQPKVIGYIVVGVVIGPSVLGIITPAAGEVSGLPEVIQMLALLGSIILLFMIGLECDLKEVYTKRSIAIAVGGVLLPWLGGFLVAGLFGYDTIDAVFIGTALVATSVAVTAGVTSELGMIGTPVAYAIIGAAVVDDVLGMVALSISKNFPEGAIDPLSILLLVGGAVLFIVLGSWIGSRFLTKLVFNVQVSGYRRKLPMSGFVLALSIAFLYSFIAETIQISAVVGAFVAGTAFSGSVLRDGFRKGTQYLEALFVPIFFVSLGVVVDISGMLDAILFGVVLTVVAVLTKIVGCGLPARLTGMKFWDSMAVGVGMTPRLEIAFIIAYVGLSSGMIGPDVYSVVVFMGLVTALFAPFLLRKSLERGGHVMLPS
ncbi:MAG: cation:proton antiporter [Thermoplasmatota archaeon]|nr:cation:proton antiporter [Candidatus Thermoplasmatota archaeon]MBU1914796.1 cation:proton antiporter [Candidatus Thermoplasmatota archaeon]